MNAFPRYQRGISVVLLTLAMLVLLVMAAFAIDTGHLVLNKSRLQSAVDASALAAAKVLDDTEGGTDLADEAARSVFDSNVATFGNEREIPDGADIVVQFSSTLNPFVPGTEPANYVRIRADSLTMVTSFLALLGIDELTTGASAVAGPSAPIQEPCDLVPMAVCGDPDAGPPDWGFTGDTVTLLKLGSQGSGSTMGPGNFQLIRLGGSGDSLVRENLAGGYHGCAELQIYTQPGVGAGPVRDGLNTRFGILHGTLKKDDYPPDVITRATEPELTSDGTLVYSDGTEVTAENMASTVSYAYDDYAQDLKDPTKYDHSKDDGGVEKRRVVAVPVVNCTNPGGGANSLPLLGVGCFFLLQPVQSGGNASYIFGQYVEECAASGVPGPIGGPGIYKIVLHDDPDSENS
jgi:hypothetical protein